MHFSLNLQKKLRRIFQKYDVAAAYLFGSTVQGKMHHESDLDIALRVDLLDLDKAPLPLQFRVFQAKNFLYSKNPKKELMNIVKTMSMYFDSKYYLDRFVNSELQRISRNKFVSP